MCVCVCVCVCVCLSHRCPGHMKSSSKSETCDLGSGWHTHTRIDTRVDTHARGSKNALSCHTPAEKCKGRACHLLGDFFEPHYSIIKDMHQVARRLL